MATGSYIGVDGKSRKITGGYIGVDGVARKIIKAYVGDSNGKARLCWSAEEVINTLYLRPSADVSVGHSLYPADSTAAYLLVNEEISDGSSTYIRSTHSDKSNMTSAASQFALSSAKPIKSGRVTSANLVCVANYSGTTNNLLRVTLTIDGEIFGEYIEQVNNTLYSNYDFSFVSNSDMVNLINEYITNNGAIPPITLSVITAAMASSSKNAGTMSITQIYLELNGEFRM